MGKVHYIDEGVGRPILFLHGNPTWSFLYRGIVIRLRQKFRCIAVDYPGFGLSVRPEDYDYTPREHAGIVRDLVRSLDLRDLTIMGHDWGGPIGMRVAVDELPAAPITPARDPERRSALRDSLTRVNERHGESLKRLAE